MAAMQVTVRRTTLPVEPSRTASVGSTGRPPAEPTDGALVDRIRRGVIGDGDTPGRKINVDVVNNVVTLRGVVDTAEQRAEAERIASNTEGVKRVLNQLKVGTASKTAKR